MILQCPSARSGWFPELFWLSSYLLLNLVTGRQGLCHHVLITKLTQTPFPQTDNFLLIKARAKILLSCHQDTWFISSLPFFHIFPRKHPAWHGLCQLTQLTHPRWPPHPGEEPPTPGRAVLAKPPLLVLHSFIYSFLRCLGWRGLANSWLFQGAGGYTQGSCPPFFTQHLCKVKEPQSGNR